MALKALAVKNGLSYHLYPVSALTMIMLMAFGMRGDYYWRKSIKKINVSSYQALSFFHWPVLKFPLIHSPAFLEPNAGHWRLMHFYCTTSCEAPSKARTDVRACRIHLGSALQKLSASAGKKPESVS